MFAVGLQFGLVGLGLKIGRNILDIETQVVKQDKNVSMG